MQNTYRPNTAGKKRCDRCMGLVLKHVKECWCGCRHFDGPRGPCGLTFEQSLQPIGLAANQVVHWTGPEAELIEKLRPKP